MTLKSVISDLFHPAAKTDSVESDSSNPKKVNLRSSYQINETNPILKMNNMGNENESSRTDDFLLDSFLNQSVRLKILIPIPFKIAREDGMYFMENDLFDIFSYGEDLKKAREELELQLSVLWNDYVLEDEAELSESSRLYKKLLLKYLGAKDGD
ncbi:hypothetical protein MmiAt1_09410 [Methanimicrococcus sp. At1]|uniref:Uncharacterized protein n=1 Tax=Methanimicrococcus hacksteinii TaxID=3028293 RepID=A0ABU3VPN9_9EURY|nr:hypothetical protein [Methanimicrococcus sp. At1]MDV0445366.1 hypothetical protein [Methanimicrococcus sp. At1]